MINNINKFFKNNKKLLISISIYLLIIFLYYKFVLHKFFTISNDAVYQYNAFYEEWVRIVVEFFKTGKFNTYSFNTFLGTDFYSAMGWCYTGDLFLPILLLFRNNIRVGLLIESILCVYISGIAMSAFLKKIKIKNDNIIVFISLIYAISGQAIWIVQDHMFHRFYAFAPLLFYAVFKYFETNKKTSFIIITAILFLQCYYYMFPTLIFLFLFCLFELIKQRKPLKEIIHKFYDLLLGLIIGFCISAIVCLPSILYMFSVVGSRKAFNNFSGWFFNTKLGIVLSYIVMNPLNVFPSLFSSSLDYNEECFNIFVTIIPFVFCLRYLSKKENLSYLILMIILQIICFIKPLNSIMHGFATPSLRWLFLLEFYILFLAAKGLSQYDKTKDKKIIGIIFGVIIFIGFVFLLILIKYRSVNYIDYIDHIKFISVGIIFEVIIFIIFNFNQKLSYILSILFILLSTISIYNYNVNENPLDLKTIDANELNEAVNDNELFFRYFYSYKDSFDGMAMNLNSSLVNRIPTTSSYCNMYETSIDHFLDITNSRMMLDWMMEISDPSALNMLGVKYYLSKDPNLSIENDVLEYVGELESYAPPKIYIYRNNEYMGFGYTSNRIKYTADYNASSDFVDYVMIDDDKFDISEYDNLTNSRLVIKEKKDNQINAEINLDSKNILLIPFPNNKGWKIRVNNNIVKPISVNGGFIGLVLDKGNNKINMSFNSPHFYSGIILSFVGLLVLLINCKLENRKDEQK